MPRGGRRPGSGRKPWHVEEYRAKMQRLLMTTVDESSARSIVVTAISQAVEGDPDARKWLGPYVFGAPPKEVRVTLDVEARIRATALAAGLDPDAALREAQSILALTAPD